MGQARRICCGLAWCLLVAALCLGGPAHAQPARSETRLPSPELKRQQDEGAALYKRGQFAEAVAVSERALALTRAEFGPDHEQVSIGAIGLGYAAEAAGRLDIAERAYREAVRVGGLAYGVDSAGVTQAVEMLANVLVRLGRAAEAEPMLDRVLAIRSGIVGGEHSYNASAHAGLGAAKLARGDNGQALASYRQAVRLLTGTPETQTLAAHVMQNEIRRQIGAFSGLAEAAWQVAQRSGGNAASLAEEGYVASQQAWTTAAGAALARMAARLGTGDSPLGQRIRRQQDAAERVVALHQEDSRELQRWSDVQRKDATYAALLERFRADSIAQSRDNAPTIKRQTELVALLQAHLAKCPPGQKKAGCEKSDSERNAITKELGELSSQSSKGSGALMSVHREMEAAEARLPGHDEFRARRKANIDEQTRLEQVVTAERKAIVAGFPEYVALTNPKPLTVAATQALLAPNEALVTLLVGPDASYVWAVTADKFQWARIPAGAKAIAEQVTALRLGLDPLAAPDTPGAVMPAFDFERAHALYKLVLAPVEGLISGKSHLVLVPTGPLTSLPFQVLVTEPAKLGQDAKETVRGAAWLARRHATSVLPSVQSLASLRRIGASLKAAEPFLGIGDPALTGPPAPPVGSKQRAASAPVLASIYRNGKADLRALRELTPLPETAAELKAIAHALKAPGDALLLRNEATETRVRTANLDRYRVIHFATHGLVAGELSGLDEPALVLTPPIRPSESDDGLLTASEVAALKLKADWVVLSACNTASGSETGAEALSGLARAFFFAGAKALLVSHWAVNSEATVWLTTQTFGALAGDQKLGRAEAFRRTLLAMIDAGLQPSHWGPFVIVGEGQGKS